MSIVEYNGPCAGGPGWRKYWDRKTKDDIISSLTVYAKQTGTLEYEIDALRAEVERLKTKAEIGEFVMEAVRQSARNKSTITAIVRLKESPCKP